MANHYYGSSSSYYSDDYDLFEYDQLLVIGGCSACCPAYNQYTVKDEVMKMWSEDHIDNIEQKLEDKIK